VKLFIVKLNRSSSGYFYEAELL